MKKREPRKLSSAIDYLLQIRHGGILDDVEAAYVMNCLRQSLEACGYRKKYPTLKTYCDWALHDVLSSKAHKHMLRNASENISSDFDWNKWQEFGKLKIKLGDVLGAFSLVREINLFAAEFSTETSILSPSEADRGFFPALGMHLHQTPIQLTDQIPSYDYMKTELGHNGSLLAFMIRSIHFTGPNDYSKAPFFEILMVSNEVTGPISFQIPTDMAFKLFDSHILASPSVTK